MSQISFPQIDPVLDRLFFFLPECVCSALSVVSHSFLAASQRYWIKKGRKLLDPKSRIRTQREFISLLIQRPPEAKIIIPLFRGLRWAVFYREFQLIRHLVEVEGCHLGQLFFEAAKLDRPDVLSFAWQLVRESPFILMEDAYINFIVVGTLAGGREIDPEVERRLLGLREERYLSLINEILSLGALHRIPLFIQLYGEKIIPHLQERLKISGYTDLANHHVSIGPHYNILGTIVQTIKGTHDRVRKSQLTYVIEEWARAGEEDALSLDCLQYQVRQVFIYLIKRNRKDDFDETLTLLRQRIPVLQLGLTICGVFFVISQEGMIAWIQERRVWEDPTTPRDAGGRKVSPESRIRRIHRRTTPRNAEGSRWILRDPVDVRNPWEIQPMPGTSSYLTGHCSTLPALGDWDLIDLYLETNEKPSDDFLIERDRIPPEIYLGLRERVPELF